MTASKMGNPKLRVTPFHSGNGRSSAAATMSVQKRTLGSRMDAGSRAPWMASKTTTGRTMPSLNNVGDRT